MDEQIQTDVTSTDISSDAGASVQDAAVPSGSQEETGQTAIAGDVTAQSVIEGQESGEVGTVDPTQDDPLEGIPSLEELEQNKSQQYAQALINLRTAYEARKEELTGLKPLESFKDIAQLGEPEVIKSKVETYDQLFTPVVNPETQQPEVDEYGFQRITTTPFIERVEAENPGMAAQLLNDLLGYQFDRGDGQPTLMWRAWFEAQGLDPTRLDDYKNIDALTVAQPTGEITQEELALIDPKYHEAFKSFNPDQREDLLKANPLAREGYLQDRAERLANQAFREQQAETQRQQTQQQEQALRERVSTEQENYVNEQLEEGFATITDDLASKVTFSESPEENQAMLGIVGLSLLALRLPDSRFANEKVLGALGVKIEPSFYEALNAADKHLRDQKAYELFGQKGRALNSAEEARKAKSLVLAKSAIIGLRLAQAMGGHLQAKANGQGKLLEGATSVRPTPGTGSDTGGEGGILPEGVLANSPEAARIIAQRSGLLKR